MNFSRPSCWLILAVGLLLSACDNNSDVGSQPSLAPTADAKILGLGTDDYSVRSGTEVIISAKDSEGLDSPILQYIWQQVDADGNPLAADNPLRVELIERSVNTKAFTAPVLGGNSTEPQSLFFRLTTIDAENESASTTLEVNVVPVIDANRFLEYPNNINNKYKVIPTLKQGYSVTNPFIIQLQRDLLVHYADRNSDNTREPNTTEAFDIGQSETVSTTMPTTTAFQWQTNTDILNRYQLPHFTFTFPSIDIDNINKNFENAQRDRRIELFALNSLIPSVRHRIIIDDPDATSACYDINDQPIACEDAFILLILDVSGKVVARSGTANVEFPIAALGNDTRAIQIAGGESIVVNAASSDGLPIETRASALAYYDAIDPDGKRESLNDWLKLAGFVDESGNKVTDETVAEAVYLNNYDLGFGREMYVRRDPATGNVFSYVVNYTDLDATLNKINPLATVAMEYSPPDQQPDGAPFVKFFTYVPDFSGDQKRVVSFDFDGRGEKYVPGVCLVCHGGRPKFLDENGNYPDFGHVDGTFMPWDLDSFLYTAADEQILVDPYIVPSDHRQETLNRYTRANQETALRQMNEAALSTLVNDRALAIAANPELEDHRFDAAIETIKGWYGANDSDKNSYALPAVNFNGNFIPSGWTQQPELYTKSYAKYCRACHLMVSEPTAHFGDFDAFASASLSIIEHVFRDGTMPLARLTQDRYWVDYAGGESGANALATFFCNQSTTPDLAYFDCSDPGANRPNKPVIKLNGTIFSPLSNTSRTGIFNNDVFVEEDETNIDNLDVVRLDASQSINAGNFAWSIVEPAETAAELFGANTSSPAFKTAEPTQYILEVVASNVFGSTTQRILIDADPLAPFQIASGPATIEEDGNLILDTNLLRFDDADSTADDIIYHITTSPAHGSILLNDTVVTQFTQGDIDRGEVSYQHNGDEFSSDSFAYIVTNSTQFDNGVEQESVEQDMHYLFNITVTLLNDKPTRNLNSADFVVPEGGSNTILTSNLQYFDESTPDQLTYNITVWPSYGALFWNDIDMQAQGITSFSQADIDNGLIVYEHTSDNQLVTEDSFGFEVADDEEPSSITENQSFTINILLIDDSPRVLSNTVTVTTGRDTAVTALHSAAIISPVTENIVVFDKDSSPQDLLLTLTIAPAGSLSLGGTALSTDDTFALQDVLQGDLRYSHENIGNVSDLEPVDDSFELALSGGGETVTDLLGNEITDGKFTVTVDAVAAEDGPVFISTLRLPLIGLSNTGVATWTQGNEATVTPTALEVTDSDNSTAAEFIYTLDSLFSTGELRINGATATVGDQFTQENVNNGDLVFVNTIEDTRLGLFRDDNDDGEDDPGINDFVNLIVIDNDGIERQGTLEVDKAVSFALDVNKALTNECTGCHQPGGSACSFSGIRGPCFTNSSGTVLHSLVAPSGTALYRCPLSGNNCSHVTIFDTTDIYYKVMRQWVQDGTPDN